MPRFQLIFRHPDGDRVELHDKTNGQPSIGGRLLVDGTVFEIRGMEWLATRAEQEDGLTRFICTLVVKPAAPSA